jgi:hypothetical protein
MEDAKRRSDRILEVERGFEWSRLEGQLMALAYECALPTVRGSPSGSVGERAKVGPNDREETTTDQQRYATGA